MDRMVGAVKRGAEMDLYVNGDELTGKASTREGLCS